MAQFDDVLAGLREVFRDELVDQVGLLERESLVLARAASDDAARVNAVSEIYRAVHSLKGASRAAAYPGLERFCHVLESRMGSARRAAVVDAARIGADVEIAVRAFRAVIEKLGAGLAPDDSALGAAERSLAAAVSTPPAPTWSAPKPAVMPVTAPAASPSRPPSPPSPSAEPPRAPAVSQVPPPPAPLRAPVNTTPPPRTSLEPDVGRTSDPGPNGLETGAVARPRATETVRVSVARLGELLTVAEELLALAGHHADDSGQLASFELSLLEAQDSLRRGERAARVRAQVAGADPYTDEVVRAFDHALAAIATLAAWTSERHEREERAWQAVATRAADVATRSRMLRVVPFGSLAPSLERAALDVAAALGKRVAVEVIGGDLELDRRVLDGLREPLLHLVRNAVDHGLGRPDERLAAGLDPVGKLVVRATVAGRHARVVVSDDGRGVDLAAVRVAARARGFDLPPEATDRDVLAVLFEPGFTTRRDVTAVSGRGVGLDVVRTRIAQLHGRVELESRRGEGASFELYVPVDLSVMRGLVARVHDLTVVFVTSAVERLLTVRPADLHTLDGRAYYRHDGRLVPVADLDATLGLARGDAHTKRDATRPGVLLAVGDRRMVVRVDALLQEREVLVKPLGPRVKRMPFVSGATLLGDNDVALVLDAADLARIARPATGPDAASTVAVTRKRILVADDSVTTRQLVRTILESAGYDVTVAADGAQAWSRIANETLFDLVVSDIEMPGLDGFQLVARIRATARTSRLPIVLVTALSSDADRQRALDLGASAYVVKRGFDQDALLDAIERLL